jgi:hypothetical protein
MKNKKRRISMEKQIWKYKLKNTELQNITMPRYSRILCVQSQKGIPCIWALVDINEKNTETRNIEIFGTGQAIPYTDPGVSRQYLGTFQIYDGDLVFHVFEYTGV